MKDELREEADQRLARRLEELGAPDPRPTCRELLRILQQRSREEYDEEVRHYSEVVVPEVARGSRDPLESWVEYGVRLAERVAPGRAVSVDESGRAHPHSSPPKPDALLLHLPDGRRDKPLLVAWPRNPSRAQEATHALLVEGKQRLDEE